MKIKKQYKSIIGLLTSHTWKQVAIASIVLIVIQSVVFAYMAWNQSTMPVGYDRWMENPGIRYSFIGLLIGVVICSEYVGVRNAKAGYTIRRLGVHQRDLFLLWMGNTFCNILMIWAVQVGMLFVGYGIFKTVTPAEWVSAQSLYISSFRSDFCHQIIPMEEMGLLLNNLALWICLSAQAACGARTKIQGKPSYMHMSIALVVVADFTLCTSGYFYMDTSEMSRYTVVALVACAVFFIMGGCQDEDED